MVVSVGFLHLIFVFTNQYLIFDYERKGNILAKSNFSWKICNIWYGTELDYQGCLFIDIFVPNYQRLIVF